MSIVFSCSATQSACCGSARFLAAAIALPSIQLVAYAKCCGDLVNPGALNNRRHAPPWD